MDGIGTVTAAVPSPDVAFEGSAGPLPAFPHASMPLEAILAGGRFDAEPFLTPGYAIRRLLERMPGCRSLRDVAAVWQPQRLKGIQVGRSSGVPFYTATQVFDVRPTARKWLAPSKTPGFAKRLVDRDWILVTCSGAVGEAIVTYTPHLQSIISHDLLRIQPFDSRDLGFVYFFLRSRVGKEMLKSSHYGSIIKHLEPEHAMELPVAPIADALRIELREMVAELSALRESAWEAQVKVEALLADAVMLGNSDVEGDESAFCVAAEDFGPRMRLDASFHRPRVKMLEETIRRFAADVQPLADVAKEIRLPNRFRRIITPSGIPFIDSEDIFKINPQISKFVAPSSMRDVDKYMVRPNWILVARSGQTYGLNGSTMLSTSWHEGKIISEHIIRVIPNGEADPAYMQGVMSHPILGKPLILRYAFGSSVPEIAPEDLAGFRLVRLQSKVESEVAALTAQAADLRTRANQLEANAVGGLEAELASGHSALNELLEGV